MVSMVLPAAMQANLRFSLRSHISSCLTLEVRDEFQVVLVPSFMPTLNLVRKILEAMHLTSDRRCVISVVGIIDGALWILKISDFCFSATPQLLFLDIFLGSKYTLQGQ